MESLWKSTKKIVFVVVVGVIVYQLFENYEAVSKEIANFFRVLQPLFIGIAIAFIANMPMRFLERNLFSWAREKRRGRERLPRALVRALSLEGLEFLGVKLDGFKNRMAIAGMDISMEDAPVRVFTVHTDEEIIVARKAAALLQKQA